MTINPAYRLSEFEFALDKVGCTALVTATGFKNSDYIGIVKTVAPELATSVPGKLSAARLPHLRIVIQIGGPQVAGAIPFDEVASRGGEASFRSCANLRASCSSTTRSTSSSQAAPQVRRRASR